MKYPRVPATATCLLCGEVFTTKPKIPAWAQLGIHLEAYHCLETAEDQTLEAGYSDIYPGVKEYAKVIRGGMRRVEEVLELQRMFRLRDRRKDPREPEKPTRKRVRSSTRGRAVAKKRTRRK